MEGLDENEIEKHLNVDEIKEKITQANELTLKDQVFATQNASQWSSTIIETILKGMQSFNKPYKYIVTVVLLQKTGGALCSTCVAHWNKDYDVVVSDKFENDTIQCLTTVYGIEI